VTADGRLVRASEDENPELLWALRGGGANFGVITSLEFRLHPIEAEVYGGLALYPFERAGEVLAAWRDTMLAAPEELSLAYAVLTAPAEEGVPERLHGRLVAAVVGMYAGPAEEGAVATLALRKLGDAADFFGPTSYADLQCAFDDPPGFRNYWTAEYLADMPDGAIDALTARAAEIDPGYSQLFIPAWGGAVARAPAGSSPLAGRDARFVVHPLLLWEDPARDERNVELGRAFRSELKEYATGATYLNFTGDEGDGRVRAAFGRNHERILRVKEEWDPDNVFRGNQSLRRDTAAVV
jgi:FAD/FMN-containing dehydrogenase